MKRKSAEMLLAFSDREGTVYDFPGLEPAFRTGKRTVPVEREELIPLPEGSYLFSLIGRVPVSYNRENNVFSEIQRDPDGDEIWALSSFLASGYLRTYLPAFARGKNAPVLPLWAYAGVVIIDGKFFVPALRIDEDQRSDPAIHRNHRELKRSIAKVTRSLPENRLVRQLAKCSTEYNCLCARNFFLGRYEAPVPTTPACNADCLGCLSLQEGDDFQSSQQRLDFKPTPDEIAEVIIRHFSAVDQGVASFGQGCEGEPLLRAKDLARAVSLVREKTGSGTININTNGSRPEMIGLLASSGIDSVRISLNSPTEKYYTRYHRPGGYSFSDVLQSIGNALEAGLHVSINLFFMPGFTDMETEVQALDSFLNKFPVHMIQTRNLNIDPDFYFDHIGFEESDPVGIRNLISILKRDHPNVALGYYNPSKEVYRTRNTLD
ncbi:MAG TPA: radical SAM protein [Spirochaetota bacterium]|nr:radical SAM protein [Spirochaetota bacterium]